VDRGGAPERGTRVLNSVWPIAPHMLQRNIGKYRRAQKAVKGDLLQRSTKDTSRCFGLNIFR
jgi:hypothetical protein